MNKTKIKLSRKYYQQMFWFAILMIVTAWLCITSPGFAEISAVVQDSSTQNQSELSLEQQAQKLYEEDKFSEAANLFKQAAQADQISSNPIRQALNLANLSLCYQQLGRWDEASSEITKSVNILNTSKNTSKNVSKNANQQRLLALAQALNIQAGLQLARGQADIALQSWKTVTSIYTQQNQPNLVLSSKINQAQALLDLGLDKRAATLLAHALSLPLADEKKLKLPADEKEPKLLADEKELKPHLQLLPTSPEIAIALCSLGEQLQVIGDFDSAMLVLESSLNLANRLHLTDIVALIQLNMGNTKAAQSQNEAALDLYKQVAVSKADINIRIKAQLNQLNLLVNAINTADQDTDKTTLIQLNQEITALLPQLKQQITVLPPGKASVEARINLAHTMMQLPEIKENRISLLEIAQILALAVQQAQELQNTRLEADALGSLGSVYELNQQWKESEELTQQAVMLARQFTQQINTQDIEYRWLWQLGRVTKAQGKIERAIAAYEEAFKTIKSLRIDLAAANPDVQFSFRDAVEPIYRQFVELLVQSHQEDNLKKARDVIEGLQLVELDNFFREVCLNAKPEQIDKVDQQASVIYPIILKDQLAIILSLPKSKGSKIKQEAKRDYRYYKTEISQDKIELVSRQLRDNLNQPNTYDILLERFQQMYDWIIAPVAKDLADSKVETLVFVLDGTLRNIPMSALYDKQKQKFLVEEYSIALTPGLQLLAPRSLQKQHLGALVAGLSEARPGYSALTNTKQEIKQIKSHIPTQILLDSGFTNKAFKEKISTLAYPIVHLATHGQFASTEKRTFLLAWDGKIGVKELGDLLKKVELSRGKQLEILILSACETAAGDAKSVLGLAGIALRSGASSTVATLWRINDKASALLMDKFYEELVGASKTGISKAEALRRAQRYILRNNDYNYKSPYYWAGYVLLGNWI